MVIFVISYECSCKYKKSNICCFMTALQKHKNIIISYIIVNYCITSKNFLVPKMSI